MPVRQAFFDKCAQHRGAGLSTLGAAPVDLFQHLRRQPLPDPLPDWRLTDRGRRLDPRGPNSAEASLRHYRTQAPVTFTPAAEGATFNLILVPFHAGARRMLVEQREAPKPGRRRTIPTP